MASITSDVSLTKERIQHIKQLCNGKISIHIACACCRTHEYNEEADYIKQLEAKRPFLSSLSSWFIEYPISDLPVRVMRPYISQKIIDKIVRKWRSWYVIYHCSICNDIQELKIDSIVSSLEDKEWKEKVLDRMDKLESKINLVDKKLAFIECMPPSEAGGILYQEAFKEELCFQQELDNIKKTMIL